MILKNKYAVIIHARVVIATKSSFLSLYSQVFTVLYNREIRRKLKSINSVLVFFAVLSIISLVIGFIVALASVSV